MEIILMLWYCRTWMHRVQPNCKTYCRKLYTV